MPGGEHFAWLSHRGIGHPKGGAHNDGYCPRHGIEQAHSRDSGCRSDGETKFALSCILGVSMAFWKYWLETYVIIQADRVAGAVY